MTLTCQSLEGRATRCHWFALLILLAYGCGGDPSTDSARAANEAAIREADVAMAKAGEAKDLAKLMTYYADEPDVPMFLPPGAPIRVGREQIARGIAEANDNQDFSITWRPVQVEVARSGDLGFVRGLYETTLKAPDGTASMDTGKYIEIWKKQSDGTWKLLMDITNSDLPTTSNPL